MGEKIQNYKQFNIGSIPKLNKNQNSKPSQIEINSNKKNYSKIESNPNIQLIQN